MERIILHSDLNNFFASVEALSTPEYRKEGVCFAVCGKAEERHGIVLAKNENAKKMGVKTGESIWQAREKCPELVICEPHYDKYESYSRIVKKIYEEYTDMVEPLGIDECWLDVTHSTSLFGDGDTIAEKIRTRVKKETGLTVSVGVSFNKVFAKLCSDIKKPDAVTSVKKSEFREKLWGLPACDMLGVGEKTAQVLTRHGVNTIGELARMPEKYLESWLGKCGIMLHEFALGLDNAPVLPSDYVNVPKSIGRGTTLPEDTSDIERVSRVLLELAFDVSTRLRKHRMLTSLITVSVKTPSFITSDHSINLPFNTRLTRCIHMAALEIFKKRVRGDFCVRSLTVRASKLTFDSEPCRFDFFTDAVKNEKIEAIESLTDKINARYGAGTLVYGAMINK